MRPFAVFLICLTLLLGMSVVGRGGETGQKCPYAKQCQAGKQCCAAAKKCGEAGNQCCQEAGQCCQAKKKCCAEATACKGTACAAKTAACCEGGACQTKIACDKNCQATECNKTLTVAEWMAAPNAASGSCSIQAGGCSSCPLEVKIEHLDQAARHLAAAGFESEARSIDERVRALRREVLVKKLNELSRLQAEVAELRQATGDAPQVLLRVQIAEVSLTQLPPESLQALGVELAENPDACVKSKSNCPDSPTQPRFTLHHCDRKAIAEFVATLHEANLLKVLAEPNLVTHEGQTASFVEGGEFPTPVVRPDGSIETRYKTFGTQVVALAKTLGDGKVHLEIRPRYTTLAPGLGIEVNGIKVPGMCIRELDIGCDAELGKTIVVGGPVQQRVESAIKFGRKVAVRNDVQMLLFVTPEAVTGSSALPTAQAPSQNRSE